MGCYVYKVLATKVRLMNGEYANLATYGYKMGWDDAADSRASGVDACIRNFDANPASRTGWVVRYWPDGRGNGIPQIYGEAMKLPKPCGAYVDDVIGAGVGNCLVDPAGVPKRFTILPKPAPQAESTYF
jgi:hypothetical protein